RGPPGADRCVLRDRGDPIGTHQGAARRPARQGSGTAQRAAPMTDSSHQGLILDQFTRQATLFSTAAPITNADALRMIIEAARPGPDDTVLDVACGGGIVVCAFAPHVRRATGIDVTPAMLNE